MKARETKGTAAITIAVSICQIGHPEQVYNNNMIEHDVWRHFVARVLAVTVSRQIII